MSVGAIAGYTPRMLRTDPELLAAVGPRIRKSPFFDRTVAAGLRSVSCYNHMWLPMSYGDPDAEYRRLTERVAMWDVAAQRHVRVAGPDADDVVQVVTARDVRSIAVGAAGYAPMVDHDGVLINDPVLLHLDERDWRFSIADGDVRLWIDSIARERSLVASVGELDTATLAIQGPRADDVVDRLGVGWSAGELDHFRLRRGRVAGIDLLVCRSGWSHQGGVELFLDDPRHAERLWALVEEAGEPFGIGPGAPDPAERLENVLLSYGTDTGYDADPLELGLEDAIDIDGPPFVGRDALRAIRERGPARRLRGVVVHGDRLGTLAHPVPLSAGAVAVGQLRAASWSPRFGANIGLALVDAACEQWSGTVAPPGSGPRDVTLLDLPFDEEDVAAAGGGATA